MNDYIQTLETEFSKNAHPEIASGQKAYMKNHFEFFGLTFPVRREIQRTFLIKKYLPPKKDANKIIEILWKKPEREYQYFAQEFAEKYVRELEPEDIALFEYMICHKSWWDTVDFIAVKLVGTYFKKYPEQIETYVEKWLASENIWLQRTALLFQLKYKTALDHKLLSQIIRKLLGTNEFFINKAIGWVLREYAKTNPNWVVDFVRQTALSKLSEREALKHIK